MLLNKSRASYQFIMVSLENPENQLLNAHFSLHLLKQCLKQKFASFKTKVYQSISISEKKRVYHY